MPDLYNFMYKSFQKWLLNEKRDIFGFEKEYGFKRKKDDDDLPINPINSEIIIAELTRLNLNNKKINNFFPDVVEWGSGEAGDIKVDISPLGSFKIIIRKLALDLEGNQAWFCKSIVPFIEFSEPNKQERAIAASIIERIQEIDGQLVEAPSSEFKKLRQLTETIINKSRGKIPPLFVYRGVNKMSEDYYQIVYGVTGHGVEAPDSRRVEQFVINVHYNPKAGLIRSWGHDISSPTRQHLWEIQPSEWDEVFMPAQPLDEIANAIVNAFSTY